MGVLALGEVLIFSVLTCIFLIGEQHLPEGLGLGAFAATVGVRSLVGELRSHKPPGVAKKKKKL